MSTDFPSFSFDRLPIAETVPQACTICPLWRRLVAFLIDSFVLGLFGAVLGAFFFDTLSQLGSVGRLIGFLITVPYFAVMESNAGSGQSLGKLLLDIKVVDARGKLLPFEQSFLRYVVFSAPLFLNGTPLPLRTPWVVLTLMGIIVLGVGGGTLYLLLFNRNSRQGLHDLAVGSYVVRAGTAGPVETRPIWKIHWAILGFLLLACAAMVAFFVHKMNQWERFPQLMQDMELILPMGNVQDVRAREPQLISGPGDRTRKVLVIEVSWTGTRADEEAFANQVARIILRNDPKIQAYDVLSIGITRGYNIGIASAWTSERIAHSPAEWSQRLSGNSPAEDATPPQ